MQPTTSPSPSRPIQASISIFNTISAYVLGFPVLNPIATGILFCDNGSLESNRKIHSFFHLSKSCSVLPNDLFLSNSLVFSLSRLTCMYLWICHEACLPSFTDSTVVFAKPATSPPAKTQGSLVCMVPVFTSGVPQRLSFTGVMASVTTSTQHISQFHALPQSKHHLQTFKPLQI